VASRPNFRISPSSNRNGSTSLRELAILCWSNSVVNAAPEGISDPDWLYRDELCVHIRPYTPALILHQSKRYSRRAGSRFARCDYRKPRFRCSGLLLQCCGSNWRRATVTAWSSDRNERTTARAVDHDCASNTHSRATIQVEREIRLGWIAIGTG
jgi:hypothetical protein